MKLLITESCIIFFAGDSQATHAEIGSTVDVPKDDASTLTRMGRALYLEKADDPTKGTLTAGPEEKATVKARVAAIDAERKARELAAAASSPASMAAMVAASVAQAVQAAMAQQAKA